MHTSEKTHQQMLPRSAALESASADKLQGKDETGRGRRGYPATVVQHGRGEIARDHLPAQRNSAEPDSSGEVEDRSLAALLVAADERAFMVDSHGRPLMPLHLTERRSPLLPARTDGVSAAK